MELEYIYLIVFIALIMLLRLRRQKKGYKASTARIFRYPAIYIVLSLILVASAFNIVIFVVALLAILVGYAVGTIFGSKSSIFYSNGKIMYRRSNEIFAIWLAAFVARIVIEFMLPDDLGLQALTTTASSAFSGIGFWYSLVDILLAFSAGMLLGESIHLYRKYKNAKHDGSA